MLNPVTTSITTNTFIDPVERPRDRDLGWECRLSMALSPVVGGALSRPAGARFSGATYRSGSPRLPSPRGRRDECPPWQEPGGQGLDRRPDHRPAAHDTDRDHLAESEPYTPLVIAAKVTAARKQVPASGRHTPPDTSAATTGLGPPRGLCRADPVPAAPPPDGPAWSRLAPCLGGASALSARRTIVPGVGCGRFHPRGHLRVTSTAMPARTVFAGPALKNRGTPDRFIGAQIRGA